MFWRKTPVVAPAEKEPTEPTPDASFDDAIDAAASILRALGKHGFALDEETPESIVAAFEKLALHVLVLGPIDGLPAGPSGRAPRRHWPSVVRFVTERRKREQAYVERTAKDARETIWALVDGVGRACAEHGKVDGPLREQAAKVQAAAAAESLADLKREATAFAGSVVQFLEEQNDRLKEQTRDLRERLSQLEVELDAARRDGGTDPLTKLANRRTFDATLERQIMFASIVGRPLTLVFVDIDHFKAINDRYGHQVGDQVLREVANCLARAFPRRTDLVARYGGEEFACILPETTPENGRVLAERMANAVRGLALEAGGARFRVTVSAGVTTLEPGDGVTKLLERADKALYVAKRTGRDRVTHSALPVSGVHRSVSLGGAPSAVAPKTGS